MGRVNTSTVQLAITESLNSASIWFVSASEAVIVAKTIVTAK